MDFVFVCGPWGSGTSAVAGVLLHLGCIGIEPFWRIDDHKTPNTYESRIFRELMLRVSSEPDLRLKEGMESSVNSELVNLRDQIGKAILGNTPDKIIPPIMLKHAMSATMIDQIHQTFSAKFVFVHRDLADIENTRARRNWPPFAGAEGAEKIYSMLSSARKLPGIQIADVDYNDLISNPADVTGRLASFCGLDSSNGNVQRVLAFIEAHPNSRRDPTGLTQP